MLLSNFNNFLYLLFQNTLSTLFINYPHIFSKELWLCHNPNPPMSFDQRHKTREDDAVHIENKTNKKYHPFSEWY